MAATRTANKANSEYSLAASDNREVMAGAETGAGDLVISAITALQQGHRRPAQIVLSFHGDCLNARTFPDCNHLKNLSTISISYVFDRRRVEWNSGVRLRPQRASGMPERRFWLKAI